MNTFMNNFIDRFPLSQNVKSCVSEKEDDYNVEVELPGFVKKDISINVDDNVLCVTAENKKRSKEFKLNLSNLVSEETISVKLENGLLLITLPKKTTSKGREIPIK
tara:strand:+ start:201 stop:518 length:318 start_codon:yes stop_codon:yes gene_type:complete